MKHLGILGIAAMVAIAACSKSTAPAPNVSGNWTGNVGTQTITMVITQSGSQVTGIGTLTPCATQANCALTFTGTFVAPQIAVTFTSGVISPFNMVGSVAGNSMGGQMNGSGFVNAAVGLVRQ